MEIMSWDGRILLMNGNQFFYNDKRRKMKDFK